MGRGKRIASLVIRIVYILLCFVVTFLFNALSNYQGVKINYVNDTVLENVTVTTKNDATVDYGIENGKLFFDINQTETYSDITISINLGNTKFNTAYFEEVLGDEKEDYREYLTALEQGPWTGTFHYVLTGEDLFVSGAENNTYSLTTSNGGDFTQTVKTSAANQKDLTTGLDFTKDQPVTVNLTMGNINSGMLKSGRYYFSLDLVLQLKEPSEEISILAEKVSTKISGKVLVDAITSANLLDVFKVSSLLTFYGAMCLFGLVFFLFVDLRSALKIAAKVAAGQKTYQVVVSTYINGVYQGSHTETRGDGSAFLAMVTFLLLMMLFVLTVPLRTLIVMGKDIYHIIVGDYDTDTYPLLGNILGSVGVYAALVALVGFISGWNIIAVIIAAVVGIALIIVANKLCKDCEEMF